MAETTIQELDRRVAALEGWKEAQEKVFLGFKEDLQDIKGRISALDQDIKGRITAMDERLTRQIADGDQELKLRITALEQKMDIQFRWIIGVQFTLMIAVIGVLVAALWGLR